MRSRSPDQRGQRRGQRALCLAAMDQSEPLGVPGCGRLRKRHLQREERREPRRAWKSDEASLPRRVPHSAFSLTRTTTGASCRMTHVVTNHRLLGASTSGSERRLISGAQRRRTQTGTPSGSSWSHGRGSVDGRRRISRPCGAGRRSSVDSGNQFSRAAWRARRPGTRQSPAPRDRSARRTLSRSCR